MSIFLKGKNPTPEDCSIYSSGKSEDHRAYSLAAVENTDIVQQIKPASEYYRSWHILSV